MMFSKLFEWATFGIMILAAISSTIAAYSHEWDKASYFAILIIMGKLALDNTEQ